MRKLNHKGSVLVFLTLGFALLGTFIGFALDFGRGYVEKSRVSRLVDGAALAAAKLLQGQPGYESEATRAACDSMVMNGAAVAMTGTGSCASITGSDLTVTVSFFDVPVAGGPPLRNVQVTGTERMPTTFLRFLGFMVPGDYSTLNLAATAQAGPERPVDLMLVLDRSGSMDATDGTNNKKINSLKTAVNGFLDLSNTFSVNDRVGMVSFATRGCGNASGGDSTSTAANCPADVILDPASSSHLTTLRNRVSGLNAIGGTNTMEALRSARAQLAPAFNDPDRVTTRKAVLLVTDGQPTFMTRNTKSHCEGDPKTGTPFNNNGPNACKLGVPTSGGSVLRYPLTSNTQSSFNQPNGTTLYLNTISCARSLSGCLTDGAMYEANLFRNCGLNNSACNSAGEHDVVFFAIAIGKIEASNPQGSLDDNAKCLLARMSNAEDIMNAATGVVQKIGTVCNNVSTTSDGDTHADLKVGCSGGVCTIDPTQEKGKVFTVDMSGNVTAQLNLVFQEIAALLKLRLVL